ncbi:MAG: hypothetical protein WDN31_08450 [Hyphomicrobium sp.]
MAPALGEDARDRGEGFAPETVDQHDVGRKGVPLVRVIDDHLPARVLAQHVPYGLLRGKPHRHALEEGECGRQRRGVLAGALRFGSRLLRARMRLSQA